MSSDLSKLLCLFKHNWFGWKENNRYRYCKNCGKWQYLEFYSNRTQEWINCENVCNHIYGIWIVKEGRDILDGTIFYIENKDEMDDTTIKFNYCPKCGILIYKKQT